MGNNMGYNSPFAIHPGETIKETLEEVGMSQAELSLRTGISEKTISLILNGKEPVTADTALKLERVLEIDQGMLVNMQARYGADKTRLEEKERLETEVKYLENYSCYSELASYGWVEKTRDSIKKVEELLRFFNVNSLKFVPSVMEVSFKRSDKGDIDNYALTAWLRVGEVKAREVEIGHYQKDVLIKNLKKIRNLTKKDDKSFFKDLVSLCKEAGVVLIHVPHFKKTKVNGATYWINDTPVIQISSYMKLADIFWFTLFHEIGHILKHGKKSSFIEIDGEKSTDQEEKEANNFAQKILIQDEKEFDDFKKGLTVQNVKISIVDFAKKIDVGPGIVAGRVGRDMNAWRWVSSLRKPINI